MSSAVQRQFNPTTKSSESNSTPDTVRQSCTVSVLDFASSPSPRPPEPNPSSDGPASRLNVQPAKPNCIPDLYVDRILDRARKAPRRARPKAEGTNYVRENGILGGTSNLTFFSESRLESLSQCLGHDGLYELVGRIASSVEERARSVKLRGYNSSRPADRPSCLENNELATKYIQRKSMYFERVHPRFPFLDRAAFESTAANQNNPHSAPKSKSWICLYHTVLALGCQYDGGGSFEPSEGESWKLFSIAIANFTDFLVLPDTVTAFQAVTAMVVYSLCVAGIALEHILISEATRRARNLVDAKFIGPAADAYGRTFWVLYSLEKITSFHLGRPSCIVDCDIACPIPCTPDSFFSGDFDWFLSFVTHARLLSRAYTSLFAVGVSDNPDAYYLNMVDQLTEELEDWTASLPDNGFRPGGRIKAHSIIDDQERMIALAMHFLYYSFHLTISRMALRHLLSTEDSPFCTRRKLVMESIEHTARSLLELVPIIDVAPYTPMWIMVGIPAMSFFVLFDLVIHNPRQQQTATSLALLDVMSGHCSRMDFLSKGALPGRLVGEFAHIARNYVNEVNGRSPTGNTPQAPSDTLQGISFQPQWSLPQGVVNNFAPAEGHASFPDMNLTPESNLVESMDAEYMATVPNSLVGTDVMNLFGCWLPGLESLSYQGILGQYDAAE